MYSPKHFQEQEASVLHEFIRTFPLGLLISSLAESVEADLVPFFLDASAGVLRAHVSKANAQWSRLSEQPRALVVFQGPQGYITPSWYASKRVDGKVVPTWNYSTVQVRGEVRVVQEAEWLQEHVREMTDFFEKGREAPWAVADAPESYVRGQIKGIVGLEMRIENIEGKMKRSQNRSREDRIGVAEGLSSEGNEELGSMVRPGSI